MNDNRLEIGDSSLPGERATCAFCGRESDAGDMIWMREEDTPGTWECEDADACYVRAHPATGIYEGTCPGCGQVSLYDERCPRCVAVERAPQGTQPALFDGNAFQPQITGQLQL